MVKVTRETLVADARETLALAIRKRDRKNVLAGIDLLHQLGCDRVTEQDNEAVSLLVELDAIPTALYRHFDKNDKLLYVGVSLTVTGRTAQHETYASWFKQIACIKLEWFGSRSAALRAEEHAIKTEKPEFNKTHNQAAQCQR